MAVMIVGFGLIFQRKKETIQNKIDKEKAEEDLLCKCPFGGSGEWLHVVGFGLSKHHLIALACLYLSVLAYPFH